MQLKLLLDTGKERTLDTHGRTNAITLFRFSTVTTCTKTHITILTALRVAFAVTLGIIVALAFVNVSGRHGCLSQGRGEQNLINGMDDTVVCQSVCVDDFGPIHKHGQWVCLDKNFGAF